MLHKAFETEQQHIEPEKSDLDLIRQYAQRDVSESELWAGRQKLANDQYDRAHERFPLAYLERFAATLPGKAVMSGHNYETLPIGRYYAASVQKDATGYFLQADYYLRSDSPHVPSIELGILRDVSVGYNAGKRVCDLCEKAWSPYGAKDGCEHWPGADFDGKTCTLTYCPTEAHKAEAMEGSFVWAGCQYGAEAVPKGHPRAVDLATWHSLDAYHSFPNANLLDLLKRLQGLPQPGTGAKQMPTIEEVQAELQQTKAAHQAEAAKWQQEQAELKRAAEDGDWGRKHLAAEIIRMAGLLGKGDSYAVVMKALGEAPTVAMLLPIYEEIGKEFDCKFPPVQAHAGLGNPPPPPQEQRTETPAMPWFRRRLA